MTLILDASPLIAVMDRRDPLQPTIERLLTQEPGDLILPAPVSAEVDYLARRRLGRAAGTAFLSDLAAGKIQVACLEQPDYQVALQCDQQYADFDVGLADLSIVILAQRFKTHRILTFDHRHFRTLRPLHGGSFVLLPADA